MLPGLSEIVFLGVVGFALYVVYTRFLQPDEADVSVQGSRLTNDLRLAVEGGESIALIEAGTVLPAETEELFAGTDRDQDWIQFMLMEGGDDEPDRGRTLGQYRLGNLREGWDDRQVPVAFRIDKMGSLNVELSDEARDSKLQLESDSGSMRLDTETL